MLVANRSCNTRRKKDVNRKSKKNVVSTKNVEHTETENQENNHSIEIVDVAVDTTSVETLFAQIADQMTQMVTAVLVNGETQDQMNYRLLKDSTMCTLMPMEIVCSVH